MKRRLAIVAGALAGLAFVPASALGAPPTSWPRVDRGDLTYRGAFRLPAAVDDRRTFAYGGTALAFKAASANVYTVHPDGSGLTPVSDVPADGGGTIFWSPDGTKVGFHGSVASFVDIFVVEADGTARRAVNYTKSRRDDEFAASWQKLPTP